MTKTIKKSKSSQKKQSSVDETLITAFLKLTPEERVLSNDNAIRAIEELRNCNMILDLNTLVKMGINFYYPKSGS